MIKLTLLLLALLPPQYAQSFVIVGHEFEPFYFTSGSKGIQGACYEIIQQLCKLEERHCKFKIAPLRTAINMVKKGDADMGCPLASSPPRNSAFSFSKSLFKTRYYFYGTPALVDKINRYEDLKGFTIGVLAPSMTEVSLQKIHEFSEKNFKIVSESSALTPLRKVEKKSYQLAYSNRDLSRNWIEKTRSTLIEIPNLGEDTEYAIFFSKKKLSEKQIKSIQQRLDEIKKSGFINSTCEKYKLTPAD